MFEPSRLINEYNKLDWGEARLSGIQYAIRQADLAMDYSYMLYFRYEYASSCGGYVDGLLRHIYLVFPEMLKIFDEHPDIKMPSCCYLTTVEVVMNTFIGVVDSAAYFYQISLDDMEMYFDRYKSLCLEYGYDLEDYYVAMARFYRKTDKERAWKSFESYRAYINKKHFKNPYTIDFECEMEIYYNNIEKALKMAKPFIEGEYQNTYEASFEFGRFLCYYMLNEHDIEKAGYYYERLVSLRKKLRKRPTFFIDELLYLILTDLNKAWNFYKKESPHQAVSTIPANILEFAIISAVFMKSLLKNEKKQIHIRFSNRLPYYKENGCYQVHELAEYFDKEARDIAGKFDARNGNRNWSDLYKQYMEAANVWEK